MDDQQVQEIIDAIARIEHFTSESEKHLYALLDLARNQAKRDLSR